MTADLIRKYPAFREEDGTWTIEDLEVFAECQRVDPRTGKVVNFDDEFIDAALAKFAERQTEGYKPPVHIGHHKAGQPDPPFAGFMEGLRKEKTDQGRTVVKAKVTKVPNEVFSKIAQTRLPYRSVEIRNPANKEFSSLALLDSSVPYHKFPLTVVEDKTATVDLDKTVAFSEEGAMHVGFNFFDPQDMANPMMAQQMFSGHGRGHFADGDDGSDKQGPPSDGGGEQAPPEEGMEGGGEGGMDELLAQIPPDMLQMLLGEAGGDDQLLNELAGEGPDVMSQLAEIKELLMNLSQGMAAQTPKPDAPPILYNEDEDGTVRFSEEIKQVPGLANHLMRQDYMLRELWQFSEMMGEVVRGMTKKADISDAAASARAEKRPEPLVKMAMNFAEQAMDAEAARLRAGEKIEAHSADDLFKMFFEDPNVQAMTFTESADEKTVETKPQGGINPPPASQAVAGDAKTPKGQMAVDVPQDEIVRFAEEHPWLSVAFESPKAGEQSGADFYRELAGVWEHNLTSDQKQNYADRSQFIADNMANALAFTE